MPTIKITHQDEYFVLISEKIKNNPHFTSKQIERILKKVAKDGFQDGYNQHLENC